MPIRQLRFWLHTEHNKCLCLLSGYGEILLEADGGFTSHLQGSKQKLSQFGTGRDLGVFGYFQGERAAQLREADKKRGEEKQRMVEINSNSPKMELQAMKYNFEKVSDVSLIP